MHRHTKTFKQLGLALGAVLLLALIVHWSWNTLAGTVLALHPLNYVQALALVLLAGVAGLLLRGPGHIRRLRE